jgi:PAS domain S-box-containing protein
MQDITSSGCDYLSNTLDAAAWLAAIVDNSDDAILSKTLDGIIMTWNNGATRLFGFTAEEAVGRPVTIIIPDDRLDEEEQILARLRAGERIDHFETVRRRKDGELVDISLTVSPVRNARGEVLGASKIARDITPHKKAQQQQLLLFKEMRHRIKNLFALTMGLIGLSARHAKTVDDLAANLTSRLMALASAHELTLPEAPDQGGGAATELRALLEAILAPYETDAAGPKRIAIDGDAIVLASSALTSVALVLHELATNAAKYGALANPEGRLDLAVSRSESGAVIVWAETGAILESEPTEVGFGTRLEDAALRSIGGTIHRDWRAGGLVVTLTIPNDQLC